MANKYRSVLASGGGVQPTGNAQPADVLAGKTFSNADGIDKTGTMVNRGAVSGTATPSQPYTIPAGYHNGSGVVTSSGVELDGLMVISGGTESVAGFDTLVNANVQTAYFALFGLCQNKTTLTLSNNATAPHFIGYSSNGTVIDREVQPVNNVIDVTNYAFFVASGATTLAANATYTLN